MRRQWRGLVEGGGGGECVCLCLGGLASKSCQTLPKLTFRAFIGANRRRANARNVSFRISLRWPIHIINFLIESNYLVILPPTQHHSFIRDFTYYLSLLGSYWGILTLGRVCTDLAALHRTATTWSQFSPVLPSCAALVSG